MKKFIVSLILIALLSLLAGFYLPWWTIAVVAFLVSLSIPQRPATAFLTGFLALFILWFAFAFMISSGNNHLLARKISVVIFKAENAFLLMLVSALIGALVAGFAALTGSFARRIPAKQRTY